MGRLVPVTGCGQVIFLLCRDHSDDGGKTNCECVPNGGIAFISINKETFSFQIFFPLQDLSFLHPVIKAERTKVRMVASVYQADSSHPSFSKQRVERLSSPSVSAVAHPLKSSNI